MHNTSSFFARYTFICFHRELEHNNFRIFARLKQLSPDAPNILTTTAILFFTFQNGEDTDEILPLDFTADHIHNLICDEDLQFTNYHTVHAKILKEKYLCDIYTDIICIQDNMLNFTAPNAVKLLQFIKHIEPFTACITFDRR